MNKKFLNKKHSIKAQFELLKKKYLEDLSKISSSSIYHHNSIDIRTLPSYKAIKKLGKQIIPYLLEDMRINKTFWFVNLQDITKYNPVVNRGTIADRINDWLLWGIENGYYLPAYDKPVVVKSFTDIKTVALNTERDIIWDALKKANYNKSEAARILKIDRKTLYNKLKTL